MHNVPGRKTDVADSAWIAQLLEHGLVRPSFVPPPGMRDLRDLTRSRSAVTQERIRVIQRLEKVMQDAGIKLTSVASQAWMAVFGAGRSSGTSTARLGNTGRAEQVGSDVPEPSADPGRGEAFGLGRLLPGPTEVGGPRPGEAELGVGDDHASGSPVRGLGSTDLRGGPAENLLSEPEDVLGIGSPEEHLPPQKVTTEFLT